MLITKHNSAVGLSGSDRLSRVNLPHLHYVLNLANTDCQICAYCLLNKQQFFKIVNLTKNESHPTLEVYHFIQIYI